MLSSWGSCICGRYIWVKYFTHSFSFVVGLLLTRNSSLNSLARSDAIVLKFPSFMLNLYTGLNGISKIIGTHFMMKYSFRPSIFKFGSLLISSLSKHDPFPKRLMKLLNTFSDTFPHRRLLDLLWRVGDQIV